MAEESKNAWITRGDADNFSLEMQLGNAEQGIPGLGPDPSGRLHGNYPIKI
jgi:hypothetical protein